MLLFQLLIIALVWVSIAQRGRNNLIRTNRINKKVHLSIMLSYFTIIFLSRIGGIAVIKAVESVTAP